MTRILAMTLTAGLLMAGLNGPANAASCTACDAIISAQGRATRVEGGDDFIRFNRHVPADLAQRRAISAWQSYVADHCPGYSAVWRRATNTHVDCDSGMGHYDCMATGQARRKLFSWFLPH